jgi:hypothetical protein
MRKVRKDGEVVTYYVECRSCKGEIVIDEKPRGRNLATFFSGTWKRSLECRCGKVHEYTRSDIKERVTKREMAGTPARG